MKLIIQHCKNCKNKIGLDFSASNRNMLRKKVSGDTFKIKCTTCERIYTYNVKNVKAVSTENGAATGGVVGALVGLIGGPVGVIIGGIIGASLGGSNDVQEQEKIDNFNDSW